MPMLDDSCLYPFQIDRIIDMAHKVDVIDFDYKRIIVHLRRIHDSMYHIDMKFWIRFRQQSNSDYLFFRMRVQEPS